MRAIRSSIVFSTRGRPTDCRQADPSNLRATSLRNQRRMVSGFAAAATSATALRPSRWAISAKVRFSPSDSLQPAFDLGSQNPILSHQIFVAHQQFFINSSGDVGQQAGPLHFLKLSSLFLYFAVEPGVRLNSIREILVKARPQRRTAKAGRHVFSARSSFLTIRDRELAKAPVLADAGYGNDTAFRDGITELGLLYAVGVQSSVSVWLPGHGPLPKRKWKGIGRPTKLLRRDARHQPVSLRELAIGLPFSAWKTVRWREGTRDRLHSRFAARRVRPAHRDDWRSEPRAAEWLLIEWPREEAEPIKYWFSTLPENVKLQDLVRLAKHRWIVERDYQELKQELGLGHYEGRGWRGFHHHATLCIAAYGFLVAERSRFFPSARAGQVDLPVGEMPSDFRARGSPGARGAA